MQLDKTRIVIRERGFIDTLDVTLYVIRAYWRPLLKALALGAIPFGILNYFLLGWMINLESYDVIPEWDFSGFVRYTYNMGLIVFFETPFALMLITCFLGKAVFMDQPPIRQIINDAWKVSPRLIWCQLVMRGTVPAILMVALMLDRSEDFDPGVELGLLGLLALYVMLIRSIRPFLIEVVALEQNPLRSKNPNVMTVRRRSSLLHGPNGGDLFVQWIGSALIAILLFASIYGTMIFCFGVFMNDWRQGPLLVYVGAPMAMWLVAGLLTTFKFLSYLDLRIRQEGWEVELLMRAEATRLNEKHEEALI